MKRLIPAILALFLLVTPAISSHFTFLPYVPDTPLMQTVIHQREFTWCLDSRATAYPAFQAQVQDVLGQYDALVGIHNRQVPFDASCQVQMVMPDSVDCGGCAAYITYANWPVQIVYKWTLGYTDWRSAIGHELGHGLLGLHEQYLDSGGQLTCTYRTDTVMSCGPPYVRYPQPRDISLGCSIINTPWCGNPPSVECAYLGNDPCSGRFRTLDQYGQPQSFDASGKVWNAFDELEWSACYTDGFVAGLRENLRYGYLAVAGGTGDYILSRSYWTAPPRC